ncbi:cell division protein FtsL [Oleispirillum naphthae]|uniref:cell division protein FtsL n=1 Tax=Oleispirillum naphthae TaxID=2838853 RepID=UPI0030822B8F
MIRLFVVTAFLFSLVSAGLVAVKSRVQEMETRLAALQADIKEDRTAVRVLKAEWSHLNDPARLKRLAETYLHLSPVNSGQIASVSALPYAAPDEAPRLAGEPRPAPRAAPPEVASRRTAP